jgi:hypothetical protein
MSVSPPPANNPFLTTQIPLSVAAGGLTYWASRTLDPELPAFQQLGRFVTAREKLLTQLQRQAAQAPTAQRFAQLKTMSQRVQLAQPPSRIQGVSAPYARAYQVFARREGLKPLSQLKPVQSMLSLKPYQALELASSRPQAFISKLFERSIADPRYNSAFFQRMTASLNRASHLKALLYGMMATIGLVSMFECCGKPPEPPTHERARG